MHLSQPKNDEMYFNSRYDNIFDLELKFSYVGLVDFYFQTMT